MIESARLSIHRQYCLSEKKYIIPRSHYSPHPPDRKSFMNKPDLLIHYSVPCSFLHSTQVCWTQVPLGTQGLSNMTLICHVLSHSLGQKVYAVNVLFNILLLFFLMHIYISQGKQVHEANPVLRVEGGESCPQFFGKFISV